MPLNDWLCPLCNKSEEIFTKSRTGESEVLCKSCHTVMTKQFPKVAKTSTLWNASWNAGLEGQGIYSRSLGKRVHSQREEETIMRAKGFVPESDFGKHFIDDQQAKLAAEKAAGDAESRRWLDNVAKFDGNKELAAAETWPAHEMLKQ
jgi:transcription elongation factor Elf1